MSTKTLDDVLEHYGIKGMRWGVRRSKEQLAKARRTKEYSPEAAKAKESLKTAKKKGPQALSNKELQELNQRLNLEQQYSRLTDKPGRIKRGHNAVKNILGVAQTANEVAKFANTDLGKQIVSGARGKKTKEKEK